jgi:hypothetical protein
MTLVKKNGGQAIAVYPEKESDKVRQIFDDGRCNFICRADYTAGSDMEKMIKLIIDEIAIKSELERKTYVLANK